MSAEAQLELRLVGPAQGVSVLKGGEGVTGVAVGDEAKIVPGSRTEDGKVREGPWAGTVAGASAPWRPRYLYAKEKSIKNVSWLQK